VSDLEVNAFLPYQFPDPPYVPPGKALDQHQPWATGQSGDPMADAAEAATDA
jgi:hypothetical protein